MLRKLWNAIFLWGSQDSPVLQARQTRRLLFTIHGIRTRGIWQEALALELKGRDWTHCPFKYGYFSLPQFLNKRSREKISETFRDWYFKRCAEFEPDEKMRRSRRPSIVAHSFGSLVVGEAMKKYKGIKFDKIILCGSILPQNFDWLELLARNQVWKVRNEYAEADKWSRRVGRLVPQTGPSGCYGFNMDTTCIMQPRFEYYKHSDYFKLGHAQQSWIPFLEDTSLQVHVQHSNEIEHGFTEIANQMHAIDLECYSHLPGFAQVDIPRGLSTEWTKFNPDIYTILIDELADRVVGYTNTIPLREETFRKILNGEQDDSKISGHHVVPFDTGESIYLYFMSIVIEPGARRMNQGIYQEAFELLLSAVEAKILDYYRLFGTKVIEIGAVGWTVEGRQLCEALGLQQYGTDKAGNPTYSLQVTNAVSHRGKLRGLLYRLKKSYEVPAAIAKNNQSL